MAEQLDLFQETRLSYSSARLLQGCERRYWHYKVNNTSKDEDAQDDTRAFAVGKAFHYVLEKSKHLKPDKPVNDLEYCVGTMGLSEEDIPLVHAMLLKYLRLRKRQNFEALGIELEIKDDKTIGYIDLVERDNDSGLWWITDLKTAKTFWKTTISRLPSDRQLNLYASFAPMVAEMLGLSMDDFGGCRYRVTTKSTAKQRKGETYNDYVLRMADNNIKSYDVVVPKSVMRPLEVKMEHETLHRRSLEIRQKPESEVPQNFGYCENYFKPCPYWSKCHGGNFTDMEDALEVNIED